MSAVIVAHLSVKDHAHFIKAFHEGAATRKAGGVTQEGLYHGAHKPDHLTALHYFHDIHTADAFHKQPALLEWLKANGVEHHEISVLDTAK